jgi:hypothetical protein
LRQVADDNELSPVEHITPTATEYLDQVPSNLSAQSSPCPDADAEEGKLLNPSLGPLNFVAFADVETASCVANDQILIPDAFILASHSPSTLYASGSPTISSSDSNYSPFSTSAFSGSDSRPPESEISHLRQATYGCLPSHQQFHFSCAQEQHASASAPLSAHSAQNQQDSSTSRCLQTLHSASSGPVRIPRATPLLRCGMCPVVFSREKDLR